jgi:formate dehydrogenase major subunit
VPAKVIPPDELPDAEYPMVLSTGRVLEHWHTGSMTRRASVLDQIEPEAVAFMSPKDMRQLKCGPAISSPADPPRRGRGQGALRPRRAENMVFMPFCYAEAAANLLDQPGARSVRQDTEFKFCAVKAEKVEQQVAAE